MYLLYNALLFSYFLAVFPALCYRRWKYGKPLVGVSQRLGRLPVGVNPQRTASIWIHAVSVGEAIASRPLIRALRTAYPAHRLLMSTTTTTGQDVAQQFGSDLDAVFYAPFDFTPVVTRALERIAPELLIVIDTEIWPNLFRACRKRGVRTMLVNGRLSDRSYGRYRLVRFFMRRVFEDVDRVCAQTATWAQRYVDIGADQSSVMVTGSVKFDALDPSMSSVVQPASDDVLSCFRFAKRRPVFIAASTLRGEEELVLRVVGRILEIASDALIIIAPRHPERFDEVRAMAEVAGYRVQARSELRGQDSDTPIVLLDTIGELACLFQVASVVFVGGSLVPAGGHNLLEPAVFGKAIIVGPHMDNFAEITSHFVAQKAVVQVRDATEFEIESVDLVRDRGRRERLGNAARELVESCRGATKRTMTIAAGLLTPETKNVSDETVQLSIIP
jgi:3-deoxy-D-manno-octulosonic-acid transferase